MTEIKRIQDTLESLVNAAYSIVIDGMAKGTLKPEYHSHTRYKVTKFEYGESGITNKRVKPERFSAPSWYQAGNSVYFEGIINRKVYKDALRALLNSYGLQKTHCRHYLWSLTARIARDTLEGKISRPKHLAKYVGLFLKDLNEEKHEYRIGVQLKGLILQPNSIKLDGNTKLRKPIRRDLEVEDPGPYRPFSSRLRPLEDPTAILNTIIHAKTETELYLEIDRGIEILRLFQVGSVQDVKNIIDKDSIIYRTRYEFSDEQLLGQDSYLITERDAERLKTFWLRMKRIDLPIPVERGVPKEPTALAISYERYSNALDDKIFENRIFSAIMGLEALYLMEKQEMSYRLRMRAAKLLSLIGYDHNEIVERIKDAYEVRSTYVHGEILKQQDRRKLERKHGNLDEFSKTIVDYLRASIIALLKRPNKNSLIQKIDDSFLDAEKEEEIRKLLFMPYEKEVLDAAG